MGKADTSRNQERTIPQVMRTPAHGIESRQSAQWMPNPAPASEPQRKGLSIHHP